MYLKVVLCNVFLFSVVRGADILGVFMTPSHSHQIVYQPIWKELSLRGHRVTVYTPNPLNDPTLTNLTEIRLNSFDYWKNNTISNRQSNINDLVKTHSAIYESQMLQPEMQELIKNPKNKHYDLFLVEYIYPSMYPFKDVYKCPMVGLSSSPIGIKTADTLGMSKHPVLDPEPLLPFSIATTFKEKVISTFHTIAYRLISKYMLTPHFNTEARRFFGEDTRDIYAIAREVSLVLANTNSAIQNSRPTVPMYVGIAGIHIQPPKPLPKDIKKYLDDAKEGAIYFSLGSSVKTNLLDKTKLEIILAAFSELPYKILWKYETNDFENLPSNVEIRKWVPQQDVLRHPNVKLFVSQGGIQSVDEGLNSTTPMLFIPIFVDQHFNAHQMVVNGAGLKINLIEMTKDGLVANINEVIRNPQYKEAVTKLAAIAFDQPMPALEKAIWWIEYVLRHKGASHLRYKAMDMPTYQYYLLDVYGLFAVVLLVVTCIIYKTLKIIACGYRYIRRKLVKQSSSVKKSQ